MQRRINAMTLQELQAQVRVAEIERVDEHKPGYYAMIPTSLLQLYRDRITELEEAKRREDTLLANALQVEAR
eukprot:91354-Amphidinium_carterae.1